MKKCIALFDFDGTITREDSFIEFIKYAVGVWKFRLGLLILSPVIILYMAHIIPNYRLKNIFLTYFFKDMDETGFKETAAAFSRSLDRYVKETALQKVQWHLEQKHRVVVVSASIDLWLLEWCNKYGLELIATKLEIVNGKITGRLSSKNCFGAEKARRIQEEINLAEYDYIYAYGDSHGDKEMLALAHEPHYRSFS